MIPYRELMNTTGSTNTDLPVVLTIASSDTGAGTGIQADIKTFSEFGVYGTCAITAITSQTPSAIRGIHPVPADWLREQILAVSEGFPINAAKTGMLYSRELVEVVAAADLTQGIPILVVDPRMVSSTGVQLMLPDAVDAMKELLLPLARVVTPNVAEASILAEIDIRTMDDLRLAARKISETYDVTCVAKGGDLLGDDVIDVLADEQGLEEYVLPRVDIDVNHGAGCAFSAALTASIAKGMLMSDAVLAAKQFVHEALERALRVGRHHPLNFMGQR